MTIRRINAFTLIELLVVVAIIAILAALLLPALVAARERANRAACSSNLGEMGKATENYLGQYGNYYPGGQAWRRMATPGQPYAWTEQNLETFTHLQMEGDTNPGQFEVITVDPDGLYSDAENWTNWYRCLGVGKQRASAPGALKMAPRGLGLLLFTGTLPDAKGFYCPSAGNISYASGPDQDGYYNGGDTGIPQQNLRDWLTAGGFGKLTLVRGNWEQIRWHYNKPYGYTILAQYSYRNQPLNRYIGGPTALLNPITVPYTMPKVTTNSNCPAFKTPKMLKGRALVSDSFDKYYGAPDSHAGYGFYVHKDGYNVLYGNYNVAWYSDGEQRIIYWDQWQAGETFEGHAGAADAVSGGISNTVNQVQSHFVSGCKANTGMESALLWHTFDQSAQIDVGVAFEPPN